MTADGMLAALGDARTQFSAAARSRKAALISAARDVACRDPRRLREYHDALLFVSAYPDSATIHRLARGELSRMASVVQRRYRSSPAAAARRFDNSGIAHARLRYGFTIDMARWLADAFGEDVDIAWDQESAGEAFDEFLPLLVPAAERDGLLTNRISTLEWIRLAIGRRRMTTLQWVLERFSRLRGQGELIERSFDSLDLELCWRLRRPRASRTLNRFPPRPIFFQRGDLQKRISLDAILKEPLAIPPPLSRAKAGAVLDACRAALCVRRREIDTLTYVNEREVYLFRLDRGIDVAVLGMRPDRRLAVESYFGFVAARNRVPVGYGGGWVFFDRCEIGVNVFDEFRGGESARIFASVMHVYRRLFRVHRFQVDPYQFGADNPEAIRSGAFWFYYRLGYRPSDAASASLAAEEYQALRRERGRRSPARLLRRLARSDLAYDVPGGRGGRSPRPDLTAIGLAVTRWIARRFGGDRDAALRWAARRAGRELGAGADRRWPPLEREAFDRLSVLLGPLQGIARWPRDEKRRVARALRSKAGVRERQYALALQRCTLLRAALAELPAG